MVGVACRVERVPGVEVRVRGSLFQKTRTTSRDDDLCNRRVLQPRATCNQLEHEGEVKQHAHLRKCGTLRSLHELDYRRHKIPFEGA